MDLYDQPANLFVARFLGTANVFRGVIDQQGGQTLFQSESGMQFPLKSAERGERSVVFRPQNVTIGLAGELDQPRLDGTVRHLEFLGNIIRYAVQVGQDTVLVDDPHQGGIMAFPVGAPVSIGLKSDQILTLPA